MVVSDEVTTFDARVVPVMPAAGADVAAIEPLPVVDSVAPLPTTIAAVVLVPEVRASNPTELPPLASRLIVFAVGVVMVTVCPEEVSVTSPDSPLMVVTPPPPPPP